MNKKFANQIQTKQKSKFAGHKKNLPKVPKNWQGILWSCDVKKLDWQKDKNYIIHQALMYGDLNDIALLFKIYSKKEIKEVFLKCPKKIYSASMFYFVKNFILNLRKKKLSKDRYVATLF